jgi:hypothetical protein
VIVSIVATNEPATYWMMRQEQNRKYFFCAFHIHFRMISFYFLLFVTIHVILHKKKSVYLDAETWNSKNISFSIENQLFVSEYKMMKTTNWSVKKKKGNNTWKTRHWKTHKLFFSMRSFWLNFMFLFLYSIDHWKW